MHKLIWFKVHWLLGFVVGVPILIIGMSGAVLSYEKEILEFINKDTYVIQTKENQRRLDEIEILQIYQEKNKNQKINSISFSSFQNSPVVLNVANNGEKKGFIVYLNPYTAEVLPQQKAKEFFMFFLKLHRWVAFYGDLQSVGKQIVAFATIAVGLLTISGVVIYFPKIKRAFFNSLLFRFRSKKRLFLSSMHSALGVWVAPFFLLMSLSGLYWSYGWYRDMIFFIMDVEQQKRVLPIKLENQQDILYDDIYTTLNIFKQNVTDEYKNATLRFALSKNQSYTVSYLLADATHSRETNLMEIDFKNNLVIDDIKFKNKKLNEQIMSSILPLHSGEYFGWFGRLAYFASSVLMVFFVITGYILYFYRKQNI